MRVLKLNCVVMEYNTSSILALISHIHTCSADYTNKRLSKKEGLVSSHGFILYLLSDGRKIAKGELAALINRDKSTTTVLVKKLVDSGLVKEEPSKEDKRSKVISITAKGKRCNNLTASISRDLLDICWKGFTEREQKQLLSLLTKMNGNLES